MKYNRTYNFSAGPAMMPEPVLEEIRDEMMNYRGSGMCVMEMSHRSKVFQQIIDEADADLRDLMGIPDNYKVLFIQGGATLQFAAVPWNLMKNGKAVYIDTGAWSSKAIKEAKKYGEVIVAASSKDKNLFAISRPHHNSASSLAILCAPLPSIRLRAFVAKTAAFSGVATKSSSLEMAEFSTPCFDE